MEHGAWDDHLEGPVERGGLDIGVAHNETIGIRGNETHEVLLDIEQDASEDRAARVAGGHLIDLVDHLRKDVAG